MSCLDRNGEITGYRAQAVRNGMVEGTASVSGGARQVTISGLSPSTLYSVQSGEEGESIGQAAKHFGFHIMAFFPTVALN